MPFAPLEAPAESTRTRARNSRPSKLLESAEKATAAHRWRVQSSEIRPTTADLAKLHDRGWKVASTARVCRARRGGGSELGRMPPRWTIPCPGMIVEDPMEHAWRSLPIGTECPWPISKSLGIAGGGP